MWMMLRPTLARFLWFDGLFLVAFVLWHGVFVFGIVPGGDDMSRRGARVVEMMMAWRS